MKLQEVKLKDKQLLLFDLDGTLIDSVPDLAYAGNQMLRTLGKDTFAEDKFRQWIGNGATIMVKRALCGQFDYSPTLPEPLVEQALALFFTSYREHCCVNTRLYPGVLATLKALKNNHHRLAMITNKPLEFVAPICDHLGISAFFELNLGGDSLVQKKPEPAPLLYACQHFDIDPANTLMIGDSKNDILAAHNANIDSIGLSYGYNNNEDIAIYQPTAVADNFAEILTLLQPLAAGSGSISI